MGFDQFFIKQFGEYILPEMLGTFALSVGSAVSNELSKPWQFH